MARDAAAEIRARLSVTLQQALRAGDRHAIAAVRSLAGAIDNAEALSNPAQSARPRIGVGAGEAPRKRLTKAEIVAIIETEIAEREQAAEQYEQLGRRAEVDAMRAQALVLNGIREAAAPD